MSYIILIDEDVVYTHRYFTHVVGEDLNEALDFLFAYEEAMIQDTGLFPVWTDVATEEIYNPKDVVYITEKDYREDESTAYVYYIEIYGDNRGVVTIILMEDFA